MTSKNPDSKVFIFAGEQSGDIHGSKLIDAIYKVYPSKTIVGVGGSRMRKMGLEPILKMEDFQVMGFTDVFWSFPKLWRHFHTLRDYILEAQPSHVILIDYPGFNLRMARALRNKGYTGKIIQYICPSVWAWGKGRITQMTSTLDLLLTIYPFEPTYFSNTTLPVSYIGHPLAESIASYQYRDDWCHNLGIREKAQLIALFPGSRVGEIVRNLPIQLEAAKRLRKEMPQVQFAISTAQPEHRELINSIIRSTPNADRLDVVFVPGQFNYELMRDCRTAIAKSGTITLELALHSCPTVVIYCLTTLNRIYAQYILRLNLPFYCIVNILKGKQVFPELITAGCNPDNVYKSVLGLHRDGHARQECIQSCNEIQALLKTSNSSEAAAHLIFEGTA